MAGLIAAIDLKRKMYVEFEDAPYHMLDVEVSRPTARGGQTLVRVKMRNLLNRAVFDKTFKAQDKLKEPDLVMVPASYQFADGTGLHFMDLENFETLTLNDDIVGDDRLLLTDNLEVQVQKFNGNPIGLQLPLPPSPSTPERAASTKGRPEKPSSDGETTLLINPGPRHPVHQAVGLLVLVEA